MQFLHKIAKKRAVLVLTFFVSLVIFCGHMVNIDQDLPPWGVAHYMPIDEGTYSLMAHNLYEYGKLVPSTLENGMQPVVSSQIRNNIIGNLVTYMSLRVFGNNYYGLRMPNFLFGFINLLLIGAIVFKLDKKYGSKKYRGWASALTMIFFSIDFTYLISSRVSETSMLRMTFVLLVILAYIHMEKSYVLRFALIGVLVIISVFLVYITNTFLFLACGLMVLFAGFKDGKKAFWKAALSFGLACIVAFVLCEIYYYSCWDVSGISNALDTMGGFLKSNILNHYDVSFSIKKIIKAVMYFWGADSSLYNLPLMFSAIATFPAIIYGVFIKKDENTAIIFFVIASLFLQTCFSEDFILRKFTIVFPLVLIIALVGYWTYPEFKAVMQIWSNKHDHKLKWVPIAGISYLVLTTIFILCIALFRLIIINDGSRLDIGLFNKAIIIFFGFLPVLFVTVVLIYKINGCKKNIQMFSVQSISILVVSIVLVNISLSLKYVWINPTFTEKQVMIDLGKWADGKYLIGEYQNGFLLYNSVKSVPQETYEDRGNVAEKYRDMAYYFDYADDEDHGMRSFFDETVFKESKYSVIAVKKFEREYQIFGDKRGVSLYKVVPKHEAVKHYMDTFEALEKSDDYKNMSEKERPKNPYTNIYGDINSDIKNSIYVSIYGNIYGDVEEDIYGDVYGDIHGNVIAPIHGNVYGKIYGKVDCQQ